MKKIFSLIGVMIFSMVLLAQQVPQGMKYQAVARNLKGEILANEQISLRISLSSQKGGNAITHYSEIHEVVTNEVGLFTLVIGEGKSGNSKFSNVPWSTDDVWMEIAIGDKSKKSFSSISNSKLLAVPYAFHAATANQLVSKDGSTYLAKGPGGGGGAGSDAPSPTSGNSWNTQGNLVTNPLTDYVGTADNTDLIFKTNGAERLRITAGGKLITPSGVGLELGGNLQVKGDSTIINNDLYVGRDVILNYLPWDLAPGSSPSGTPIEGQTINRGNFTVSDMSSTVLTGSLTVEKLVRFNDATQSTSATSGALVVTGGVGIGKNLNVDGTLSVLGNVSVNTDKFNITASNGNTGIAGTLGVTGSVAVNTDKFNIDASNGNTGIAGTLGVTGNVAVNTDKFNIDASNGNTGIAGTLGVTGNVAVNTNKFNIDASNGNTGIAGTLGVTGITTLNNSVFANGQVKINKQLGQGQSDYANYPLQVEGSAQGIAIKLLHTGESQPTQNNNFIAFLNSSGSFRGRIEGYPGGFANIKSLAETLIDNMDIGDYEGSDEEEDPGEAQYPEGQAPTDAAAIFSSNAAYEGYERAIDFFAGIFRFATNLAAATLLCVGGDCDDVIWSAVDMGVAAGKLAFFIYVDNAEAGVSYESGGADYAEWLPKLIKEEKLSYGDVVGVKGGIISKTFKEADKYMIVSFAPAVIGGMPEMGKEESFEKIAFMGQVIVKVMGVVNRGDYILPSGNGDGFAIAISQEKMKALDYKRVIGVAWGESDGKDLFKYVKTAVGINTNDMAGMIENMQSIMNNMQDAIKKVSPGYVPSYFSVNGSYVNSTGGYSTMPTLNEQLKAHVGSAEKGQDLANRLMEVNTSLKSRGVDLSKYKLIDQCLKNPTKENAQLLADRSAKILAKLQTTYAAGKALR